MAVDRIRKTKVCLSTFSNVTRRMAGEEVKIVSYYVTWERGKLNIAI